MKAITPVIALVMLMLITVGIVGVSYSWFSGLFSSQTKKFISIPTGGAYCSGGDIRVYALNNGDSVITASDMNGDVNIQPSRSGLVINYPGIEGRHVVRIGTSSGVAETTVNCA